MRLLLVESLTLSLAGGALALLITSWTAGTLMKFVPSGDFPLSLNIQADRTVLLVTLALSLLTGVIFGILPALRSSGVAPIAVLKEETGTVSGGLRKARLASGLVVAQISLSLVLLVCAGLFIRSFLSAQAINLGFNEHNVAIASYDLFTADYSKERGAEFHRQLLAKLEALPGIQSVALSSREPGLSPGSTSVTSMPKGAISGIVPSKKPSIPHLVAAYTPIVG